MLDELKQNCRIVADHTIPNWDDLSKNDLCRLALQNKDDPVLYNGYISAILCKYWHLISKYHRMCNGLASPETCYDWLIIAITYALEHHMWDNPESNIYNDPNGPDKVINRSMKSSRLNLYQFTNRKKRKDEFGMLSLEELEEAFNNNSIFSEDLISNNTSELPLEFKDYVRNAFGRKDYFLAFMLDMIVLAPVFDIIKNPQDGSNSQNFNTRKLAKYLREIDESYCRSFASRYDLDTQQVISTLKYCGNMQSSAIYDRINLYMNKLRHEPTFVKTWGGGRTVDYVD